MAGFPMGSQHGDLDCYQNLITSFFYHTGPFDKNSSQSIHNFLSNAANKQTEKQTNAT